MSSLVSEEFCKPRAYKSVNSSETFLFSEVKEIQSENYESDNDEKSDGCEIS